MKVCQTRSWSDPVRHRETPTFRRGQECVSWPALLAPRCAEQVRTLGVTNPRYFIPFSAAKMHPSSGQAHFKFVTKLGIKRRGSNVQAYLSRDGRPDRERSFSRGGVDEGLLRGHPEQVHPRGVLEEADTVLRVRGQLPLPRVRRLQLNADGARRFHNLFYSSREIWVIRRCYSENEPGGRISTAFVNPIQRWVALWPWPPHCRRWAL